MSVFGSRHIKHPLFVEHPHLFGNKNTWIYVSGKWEGQEGTGSRQEPNPSNQYLAVISGGGESVWQC